MNIKIMKERMENEYKQLTTYKEAYQFNRGFIWGTSFRSTKEEREVLFDFNEKLINKKEKGGNQ